MARPINLLVMQSNCQRAYAVMCDVGAVMSERRVSVALLQEPYVRKGRIVGLPSRMDVFANKGEMVKAAVVVNDPGLEVMCVRECTNEWGECVAEGGLWGNVCRVCVLPVWGGY